MLPFNNDKIQQNKIRWILQAFLNVSPAEKFWKSRNDGFEDSLSLSSVLSACFEASKLRDLIR